MFATTNLRKDRQPICARCERLDNHDPTRYSVLDDAAIQQWLDRFAGILLKRNSLLNLQIRREIGGLLCAFAQRHPRQRELFESLARTTCNLDYTDGRRHITLWVYWPQCVATLERLERDAKRLGRQFVVPGFRRLLALAGVTERRGDSNTTSPTPPSPVAPLVLPDDIRALKRIVRGVMMENRVLRERLVLARNDLAIMTAENGRLHAQIRQMPKRVKGQRLDPQLMDRDLD
jgi:hypothetical protein